MAASKKSYYEELGIDTSATRDQIQSAYDSLLQKASLCSPSPYNLPTKWITFIYIVSLLTPDLAPRVGTDKVSSLWTSPPGWKPSLALLASCFIGIEQVHVPQTLLP